MNTAEAANHTEAVEAIRAKIEEHRALAAEVVKDRTVEISKLALADAEETARRAAAEDESIEPEDLVDRRIEAGRQVEVAKIRVQRAEKVRAERLSETRGPLVEARGIAVDAITASRGPLGEKLMAGAVRVFGSMVEEEAGWFKSLIYRAGERLNGTARRLERSDHTNTDQMIRDLEHAIGLIEDANRDR